MLEDNSGHLVTCGTLPWHDGAYCECEFLGEEKKIKKKANLM
jgi:hypothetical protein